MRQQGAVSIRFTALDGAVKIIERNGSSRRRSTRNVSATRAVHELR
jgi:hypothetical protein